MSGPVRCDVHWILPRQIRIIIAITDAIITGLGKRTDGGQRKREKDREITRRDGKQRKMKRLAAD